MTAGQTMRFGKGQISGWIAAVLGSLSLCGVLCFRFPTLLTSAQFRTAYSTDFARTLLLVTLIVAYLMGVVSYALNATKRLAWIGIGTALLASILGGARIEVGDFESTAWSFGLDWFAIGFLFSMIVFIPIEKALPLHRDQPVLRGEWRTDLAYLFVSHLLIQFVFLLTNAAMAGMFGWVELQPLHEAVRRLPLVIQFAGAVLLADLFQYWSHRLYHRVGFLWRFHAVHHSSSTLDWLAGSRTHFAEVLVTRTFVMMPLWVCGFAEPALNAYVVLVGVQAVAIHANLGLDFGPLRFVLATPQFHHWHHAKDADYTDANYAVHLPLLDLLFGTFRCPRGRWPKAYGVVDGAPPPGFWRQLMHPLGRKA